MKSILILYPHFPPSNLAGVHRPRLFAQHLPSFGWEPIMLTVHENFYEEVLDHNLETLLSPSLKIEKVNAFRVGRFRLIGDLGLRAFFQLYKKAKTIIRNEKIDFLYIPIPSFYCALLGRWLISTTGIKYGIDYIDPWVHEFPGSQKVFSRHWFSTKLAKWLEPIAVRKASLITGVAPGYYQAVLERNPKLDSNLVTGAMPYGGEQADHDLLKQMDIKPYLFSKTGKQKWVYAGAMLPKAYGPLEQVFKTIKANLALFERIEFHFIGTGKTPDDALGYNIKTLAENYGLWETTVFEYPKRIPYLDVLVHLNIADVIFILGSTEPHYTPSKTYQAVLTGKPIFAVMHQESTAVEVIRQSGAGFVLGFNGEEGLEKIEEELPLMVKSFLIWIETYSPENINKQVFEKYSARAVTKELAKLLDQVVP